MESADERGRERILGRIRRALAAPDAAPHLGSSPPPEGCPAAPTPEEIRALFQPVGDAWERFCSESAALKTECIAAADSAAGAAALAQLLAGLPAGPIAVEDCAWLRELVGALPTASRAGAWHWSSAGPAPADAVAALTCADALIAATGSVLSSSGHGGRTAAVIAPCHVVIARRDQLVPDLAAALDLAQRRDLARRHSLLGLITGPSRTADIEKQLVLGAHGPRRLVVLLCG